MPVKRKIRECRQAQIRKYIINKVAPRASLSDTFLSSLLTTKKRNPYFPISLLNHKFTRIKQKGVTDIFHFGKRKTFLLVAEICDHLRLSWI